MSVIKNYRTFTLGALCALLLGACGGGGGGGGSANTYTGPTTPAAITATNGKEIAAAAFVEGTEAVTLGTIFASVAEPEGATSSSTPRIIATAQTLLGAVNKIDLTKSTPSSLSRATQTETDTFSGSCGGSAQYTISVDDVTGDFSGTFSFSNYCEEGDSINGSVSMSGNIDPNTFVFGAMTMTFSNLTISSGSDSFTIDGSITADSSAEPIVVTINIKMKDNTTGKTFWAENYTATITTTINGEEIEISGRFYHSDHGYVDLTTPTPMFIANADEWPSSGVVIATGANNSKVKLTAISNTTYNYEVDADGVYETQESGLWAEL